MGQGAGGRGNMVKRVDKSALAFLAIGVLILLGIRNLRTGSFSGPGPGLFPLCLGVLLVIFSVISFFVSNPEKLPRLSWGLIPRSAMYVIGILFAYRYSLPVFGYSVSTLILFIFLLKVVGGRSWLPTIIWSFVITCVSNLLFIQALGVLFPEGSIIPF
jgi:putative tricarboxylic transport membrane protein